MRRITLQNMLKLSVGHCGEEISAYKLATLFRCVAAQNKKYRAAIDIVSNRYRYYMVHRLVKLTIDGLYR